MPALRLVKSIKWHKDLKHAAQNPDEGVCLLELQLKTLTPHRVSELLRAWPSGVDANIFEIHSGLLF
jgi:hypothetical protein